jgi:hypothetical protein
VNTTVTYTVTFSEDMDASTVSAANFGNAGSATTTIGTVAETTPGVFTVPVTPTGAGSLQLQINAGAVLQDGAGNTLNTNPAIADDTTIAVIVDYATWSGGAAFGADSNNDGVANGMAWLLGAAGKDASGFGKLSVANRNSNGLVLDFTCLKQARRGTAVLKLQYSMDLGLTDAWSLHEAVVPGDAGGTVNGVVFTTSANADPNLIDIQATIPAGAASTGGRLFGRLHATPD